MTAWVSILLLEASRVKNGPLPTDQQLSLALEALETYHDRNSPAGDGIMVFWPQAYNSSDGLWYCYPGNMKKVTDDVDSMFNFIHKVLDDVHLEKVWNESFAGEQRIL